jgi:hypothetical protein
VERESQLADFSGFAFLEKEVHHPVVDEALREGLRAASAQRMQQIVVEMVGLEVPE